VNLIVAVSSEWGIGYKNELLFRIREDLQRFRKLTLNKVVVMGHNTFKSLPDGKPLPRRVNIVLSRDVSLQIPGVTVCNSLDALENILQEYNAQDVFVIGGEKIYNLLLDKCSTAYITKVDAKLPADTFMVNFDNLPDWTLTMEGAPMKSENISYKYYVYKRS